ncbi:MAG TPA: hypothetical protein VHA80_05265 [Solirubrobacterales bacterium]|nr:hypothetical protein [Solirubrobacterales bacterium]
MRSNLLPRRVLLAAALAIGILVATASPAAALTYGLNWDGNNSSSAELLDAVQASGATVYHQPLEYNGPGGDWTNNDGLVEEAWERGVTILPTLQNGTELPRPGDPGWAQWGAWVREAVERYGVGGTFWEGKVNPAPITAWEVWNEPNIPGVDPRPDEAASYGTFLAYTAEQIQAGARARAGAPTNVLFGALNTQVGEGYEAFLAGAASTGGLGPNVTGVAIHPYSFADGAAGMAAAVSGVRAYLDALPEGAGKSLWITEVGWPTHGHVPAGQTVDPEEAATVLTESLEWIKANAEAEDIPLVAWYNVRDFGGRTWDGYAGLQTEDGAYEPAWYAFQQQTGAERSGDHWAAFQATTWTLWLYSTAGGYEDTGLPMLPGSSPTIAAQPGGGALVSYQGPDGAPRTYSTRTGTTVVGLAAEPPAADANPLAAAFRAYIGAVWPTSDPDAFGTPAHLAPGTTPSVSTVP